MGHSSRKASSKLVLLGKAGAPFGINGWLKVNSYTDPPTNILKFKKWYLLNKLQDLDKNYNNDNSEYNLKNYSNDVNLSIAYKVIETKQVTSQLLVLLAGVLDRNQAAILTNKLIAVSREDLPDLPKGEYYWSDLIGATVYNLSGRVFGILDHIIITGANDVMVIKKDKEQYLIPYQLGKYVIDVDLYNKKILVSWD